MDESMNQEGILATCSGEDVTSLEWNGTIENSSKNTLVLWGFCTGSIIRVHPCSIHV
uniref:Uncharacterized protein n=1 Tax=Candidatus Methanogaster sp. ANME-2c ERB4 TaxID=2759911 RepID=A0A7G9YDD2_9EURY|nr:hypothetical protein GMDKAGHH_00036 [Methanosarcinales archaeon ANME-2c ERB4]QNO46016.1 hypothetical protein OOGCPJEC_00001 [Methanosarcinales archaeon ANME-2c ERB4]